MIHLSQRRDWYVSKVFAATSSHDRIMSELLFLAEYDFGSSRTRDIALTNFSISTGGSTAVANPAVTNSDRRRSSPLWQGCQQPRPQRPLSHKPQDRMVEQTRCSTGRVRIAPVSSTPPAIPRSNLA